MHSMSRPPSSSNPAFAHMTCVGHDIKVKVAKWFPTGGKNSKQQGELRSVKGTKANSGQFITGYSKVQRLA